MTYGETNYEIHGETIDDGLWLKKYLSVLFVLLNDNLCRIAHVRRWVILSQKWC